QAQDAQPRFRRVAEVVDRRAGVGEEQPRSLLVVVEHLGNAVGPSGEELRGQPRLEGLHLGAGLEPGDAVGKGHSQHRRPRSLLGRLARRDRLDARTDPAFGGPSVHGRTMRPRGPIHLLTGRSGGTADAAGLNPAALQRAWGFDSLLRHQHACQRRPMRNPPALRGRAEVARVSTPMIAWASWRIASATGDVGWVITTGTPSLTARIISTSV